MKTITAYRATRNSNGVDEIFLKIEGDKIVGEGDILYVPSADICSIGKSGDWRTNNVFLRREDAVDNYIALEESRIASAQNAVYAIRGSNE